MVTYEYRCEDCGTFEEQLPMGTATPAAACPACGRDARRVFSPPMVHQLSQPLSALYAREEASRDAPEVVHELPPAPRRPAARPRPELERMRRP